MMQTKTSKPIPFFEGLYMATSEGQIISCEKTWISGNKSCIVRRKSETILNPGIDKYGYQKVTLMKDGKAHYFTVHRLIALTFVANPNCLPQVNHIDGNKANNRPGNLEWATSKQNINHAWGMGLSRPSPQKRGGENSKAKLSNEQAKEIRSSNGSVRVLAKEYGVHHSIIAGIKKGTRYATNQQTEK